MSKNSPTAWKSDALVAKEGETIAEYIARAWKVDKDTWKPQRESEESILNECGIAIGSQTDVEDEEWYRRLVANLRRMPDHSSDEIELWVYIVIDS